MRFSSLICFRHEEFQPVRTHRVLVISALLPPLFAQQPPPAADKPTTPAVVPPQAGVRVTMPAVIASNNGTGRTIGNAKAGEDQCRP